MINELNKFIKKYFIFEVIIYFLVIIYFCHPIIKFKKSELSQTNSNEYVYTNSLTNIAILYEKLNNIIQSNVHETNFENIKYYQIYYIKQSFSTRIKFFKYLTVSADSRKLSYSTIKIISRPPPYFA